MRAARRREVWLVLFPGSEMLDLGGPWEVLSHANDVLGFEGYALRVHTPFGGNVRTRHGLVFAGTRSLRSAARHPMPDLAIIAGGSPLAPLPLAEAKCARWLRQHQRRIPTLVSICTGAFVLGEAGLLDGRRVTTHWRWMDALRARFPRAHVVDEGIFERDGRLWTSAGISAGIDLTLAIVEEDHGRAAAMAVAKNLVLFLRRSGSQAQFSEALQRQEREPSRLQDITSFVLEHLEEGLPVERLARHLGMSPR